MSERTTQTNAPASAFRRQDLGHEPDPRFESINALVIARTLMATVRAGVIEELRGGAQTAQDLAKSLDVDAQTLTLLLRVLVASGYASLDDDRFSLTDVGRDLLLADSPNSRAAAVGLGEVMWKQLESLDDVLKTGKGVDMHHTLTDPVGWAAYQHEMLDAASMSAPGIAAALPVREGATKLLDIAGSHGMHGAAVARAHPPMKSLVIDLPDALEEAVKLARKAGIDDVVTHQAADILVDEFPAGQDVVFLGNILHHFEEDQCDAIVARVRKALVPGGTIAIWENPGRDFEGTPDLITDTSGVIFRVMSTGRSYRAGEYLNWLDTNGFEDTKVTSFPPFNALVTGRVPAS